MIEILIDKLKQIYKNFKDQKKSKIFYFEFVENNCNVQNYGNVPIWEPCNYASNIAYYRAVVQICERQKWSMPKKSGMLLL